MERVWRPRFLISIISANDRINRVKHSWHWSNLDQPGSSPRKPSHQSLMTLLIKSTHTCGQTLVKGMVKPYSNPYVFDLLSNFCRVLKFSLKHFKFSQYKRYLVFRGTQLCFWMAFRIWSGRGWKLGQQQSSTIHRRHERQQLCMQFMLKPLIKT
jgi:hypothetical protein